jgi:hypothetical protein
VIAQPEAHVFGLIPLVGHEILEKRFDVILERVGLLEAL